MGPAPSYQPRTRHVGAGTGRDSSKVLPEGGDGRKSSNSMIGNRQFENSAHLAMELLQHPARSRQPVRLHLMSLRPYVAMVEQGRQPDSSTYQWRSLRRERSGSSSLRRRSYCVRINPQRLVLFTTSSSTPSSICRRGKSRRVNGDSLRCGAVVRTASVNSVSSTTLGNS